MKQTAELMKRLRAAPWTLALLPILLGAGWRFHYASAAYGVYHVSGDGNEEGYYETAVALLTHRTLSNGAPGTEPSAFRGPIYPTFLALVEAGFSRFHPGRVRLAQAALHTFGIATVFALGLAAASPLAGLFGALAVALHPDLIAAVASLNVHGFYGFCLLAVAAAAVLWAEAPAAATALALGLTLAASLLCRSAIFPLPAFYLAAGAWWWRASPARPRRLALLALFICVGLAPMIARNALHFRRFILLDAQKGSYVLMRSTVGGYRNTTEDQALDAAEAVEPGFRSRGLEGTALHEELLRLARKNILRHPVRYAGYCLERLVYFWKGMWLPALLAVFGAYAYRGRPRFQALFLAAAGFVGYAAAGGIDEYRVSALPVLLAAAGCGASAALASWAGPRLPAAWTRPAPEEARLTLRASAGALLLIYAGALVFLVLEAVEHPGVVAPMSAAGRHGRIDERESAVLGLSALAHGPASRAAELHISGLMQLAEVQRRRGDPRAEAATHAEALRWADRRARRLEGAADAGPDSRKALARAHVARVELRARLGGGVREDLRRELAQADLERALAADADEACSSFLGGRPPAEKEFFDACLRRYPGDTRLLVDRGVTRWRAGDLAAAIRDFRKALASNPASLEAAVSLATALGPAGRAEAASILDASMAAARSRRGEGVYARAAELRGSLERPGSAP